MNTNENPEIPGLKDPPRPLPPVTPVTNANDETETPGITDPPVGVTPITAESAKTLVKLYQATADAPANPVKAVFLDRMQLEAMKQLAVENPSLSGFRIYFGKETTGLKVAIVVGVDKNNSDVVTKNIYKTASPGTGLCPPICDNTSPINKD